MTTILNIYDFWGRGETCEILKTISVKILSKFCATFVRFNFLENKQQLQNHLACYFLLNKSWIPVHYLGQN